MARSTFKLGSTSRFIQIEHWFYDSPAWQSLKPGPRALYLELKRKFNGYNNGTVFLSQRDASEALNIGRDTVGVYYSELEAKGFIVKTMGHCLGPKGIGQAAKWALTECPLNEAPATKDFRRWKKQNPRKKIQHSLAGKSSTPCRKIQHTGNQMSENPTAFATNNAITVLDNPAIYTSNHIPKVPDLSLFADQDLCPLLSRSAA
ncbi:MAG: hypothetical protein JKY41_03285 [Rhodobacteraceae bacterium]|nr:hypothetical protein [Paracoccaceae bacterium]